MRVGMRTMLMACPGSDSRAASYRHTYSSFFFSFSAAVERKPVDGSLTDSSYCLIHSPARERQNRKTEKKGPASGRENNRPRPYIQRETFHLPIINDGIQWEMCCHVSHGFISFKTTHKLGEKKRAI